MVASVSVPFRYSLSPTFRFVVATVSVLVAVPEVIGTVTPVTVLSEP